MGNKTRDRLVRHYFCSNLAECFSLIRKSDITEICVAVAYVKKPGLECLADIGLFDIMRHVHTRVIISLDFGITDVDAISLLKEIGADVRVIKLKQGEFHPKIYIIRYVDGTAYAIIGSANLTLGAFTNNIEANVVIYGNVEEEIFRELRDFFENLWRIAVEVGDKIIDIYSERRRRLKEAGKAQEVIGEDVAEQLFIHKTRFYVTGVSDFVIVEISDLPPELPISSNPLTYEQLLSEYQKKVKKVVTVEMENSLKILSRSSKIIPASPAEIVDALEFSKVRIIHGNLSLEEFAKRAYQLLERMPDRVYYQIKRESDNSFCLRKIQGEALDSFKVFNISEEVAASYLLQVFHKYGLFQPNIDSEVYIIARCVVYSPRKRVSDKFYNDQNLIACASRWRGPTKRKAFWYAVGLALCRFRYGGSLFHGPTRLARGYEVGKGKGTAFKSRAQKNRFARRFAERLSKVGYLIVNGDRYQANLPYLAERGFYDILLSSVILSVRKEDDIYKVKAQLLRPFKLTNVLSLKAEVKP